MFGGKSKKEWKIEKIGQVNVGSGGEGEIFEKKMKRLDNKLKILC